MLVLPDDTEVKNSVRFIYTPTIDPCREPPPKKAKLGGATATERGGPVAGASEDDVECGGWTSEYEYHSESDATNDDEIEDSAAQARKVGGGRDGVLQVAVEGCSLPKSSACVKLQLLLYVHT